MPLLTGITSSGQLARAASGLEWSRLILQNTGTVALTIYYNADGSGDPALILAAGTANDDGTGTIVVDTTYEGAVFVKAPAGGGRLLVT